MTSEVNFVKTNEFLQRRKLRLQQVREQSKDIAKKIRQRAKVETLRQVKDVDAQKKKQYLECQKQFVDKLQEIYANGLQDVGKGHKNASEHLQQDVEKKIDKSKLRGKDAVAEVRRRKQEILDKKKELLDRKLHAREAANEISREKSNAVAKTLIAAKESNLAVNNKELDDTDIQNNIVEPTEKVDMGTQLNLHEPTNGYQTDIPELLLTESESLRDTIDVPEKLERIKRPNLFALSDEMPSSLRGGPVNTPQFQQMKSTVTLVSEHIQNRPLRLRETETKLNKRQDEELQNIKQTILRARASKAKVHGNNKDDCANKNPVDTARKGSVTMYNHVTKDSRTLLGNDDNLVTRDQHLDDDAFTKAQKEETNDNLKQQELHDKIAERRNRVAVTKENVDKEYRDTLAFLNSLPKVMSDKPIRNAFMDEKRQQQLKEKREQKLQSEFRSLEKQCRGHHKCKHVKHCQSSKSPINKNDDSNDDSQYSWVPVPERTKKQSIDDISAANKHGNTVKFSNHNDYHEYRSSRKHSPPTKDIPSKSKVSSNNRYVETAIIKEMGEESTDCSSITSDSSTSENFSLNRRSNKDEIFTKLDPKLSDADRIIIYKILNSKDDKKKKSRKTKSADKIRSTQERDYETPKQKADDVKSKSSFDQLTEGIYTAVNKNGDNLTSLQFGDHPSTSDKDLLQVDAARRCPCIKLHSQDVHTKNVPTDREKDTERPVFKCQCMLNTNHPEGQTIHYPSAATSTTSLKNGETIAPDNGYIKLIDDVRQENGKFYVGTTGYLKDEAYEVVIQLRKKENANLIDGKQGEKVKNQEDDTNKKSTTRNVNVPAQNSAPEEVDISENGSREVTKKHPEDPTSPLTTAILTSKSMVDPISAKDSPKKSNITGAQDEHTKIDNVSDNNHTTSCIDRKKATSTYTQTTSSPIHKPIFMHMSSTTSTAYMSPPDIIMPKFLKQDYDPSYDETYDSIKESQNSRSYNNYKNCKCKHHVLGTKKSSHPVNLLTNCKKSSYRVEDLLTSNNISSAGELSDACCKNYKTTTDSVYCRNCYTRSKSKNCHKHKKEDNRPKTCNHRKSIAQLRDGTNKPVKYSKSNISKIKSKIPLNPIIKDYVNKLLELNKEGMKAIEIINEECSSVPTPSSSIINDNLNVNGKLLAEKKISLEQIKNILKEKIINELKDSRNDPVLKTHASNQTNKNSKLHTKLPKRKQLHKVKLLNISRKVSKASECQNYSQEIQSSKSNSTSSSFKNDLSEQPACMISKSCREKNSIPPHKISRGVQDQMIVKHQTTTAYDSKTTSNSSVPVRSRSVTIPPSTDLENIVQHNNQDKLPVPPATSTQTSAFDSEDNLMKVAEGKLQNMEKIADLTERCTKRLSNLAKVLEEVRRNKSLFYSQLTSSDSTSDSEVDRNKKKSIEKALSPPVIFSEIQVPLHKPSPTVEEKENNEGVNTFIPLLTDIPKPINFPQPQTQTSLSPSIESNNLNIENSHIKSKSKPPPALSRIYLKSEQEYIIPHELSTVLEVDSPMSLKLKTQSRNDINADDISNTSTKSVDNVDAKQVSSSAVNIAPSTSRIECPETDPLKAMKNVSRKLTKNGDLTGDSMTSNNSKLQMMDMKQFNEIMLKPFISIQEFAKKNVETVGDASNMDDNLKGVITNDDLSSLHSENSLPDVIAELLRRKIINEPFKFDSASNVNTSTTSESTMSLLALSNITKEQKKTNTLQQSKKTIVETSDSLSISSNPDLENAFQKLGMGWASSTLKKTKERLALSSSSNTSSSSGVQSRGKIVNVPPTNADYSSAHNNTTRKTQKDRDASKNVEQQTSFSNSMTVKEFLTNQLAKKITFINPSSKDLSEQEFVSLYETKMPEEMKKIVEQDQSGNSAGNCTNNRARTSTPVQIFRSMTYHSTSSSNTSNGLFSNADDLSSVKVTSNSIRNHSTSDKDDLTIPNYMLKITKGQSDCSKSD